MTLSIYNDILTIEDLCEILAIGKNTAYSLLSSKEIQAFKVGRNWKIPRDSVEKYIEGKSRS